MSAATKSTRILVVDTSTAMLHVLKNFSDQHGYESDCHSDPAGACKALSKRFERFDSDFHCVLLGWPEGSTKMVADFLAMLASTDHQHLPVVIVCQELTTEIQTLVKRRSKTRVVLWKDYQSAADIIGRAGKVTPQPAALKASPVVSTANSQSAVMDNKTAKHADRAALNKSALLIDTAPSICRDLRGLMKSAGYQVKVVPTVDEAKKLIESETFELVISDFFAHGERGEEFCRYLQSRSVASGKSPICVILTSKYSDAIVKRALSSGAISCLYKDESTELLFARIDAIARAVRPDVAADAQVETHQLLEQVQAPAILLDNKGAVAGVNTLADKLLNDTSGEQYSVTDFVNTICNSQVMAGVQTKGDLQTSSGLGVSFSYVARRIENKDKVPGVLITFDPKTFEVVESASSDEADMASASMSSQSDGAVSPPDTQAADQPHPSKAEVSVKDKVEKIQPAKKRVDLLPVDGTSAFQTNLAAILEKDAAGIRYFSLVLDVQLVAATGDRLSIGDSEPMLKIVNRSLANLYTRENSFNYLGRGQFGFILAARKQQDALEIARKLMQVMPNLVKYLNNMSLVSHGAVLRLSDDKTLSASQVLKLCRAGCDKTRSDNRDNAAFVMPMNKYLTAHETKKTPAQDTAAAD